MIDKKNKNNNYALLAKINLILLGKSTGKLHNDNMVNNYKNIIKTRKKF